MTKREIRKFLRVPDDFRILLQQGGATMQYTAIVKNLIGLKPYRKGMHMRTGLWSSQCYDELRKHCEPVLVADNLDNGCSRLDPPEKWKIDP